MTSKTSVAALLSFLSGVHISSQSAPLFSPQPEGAPAKFQLVLPMVALTKTKRQIILASAPTRSTASAGRNLLTTCVGTSPTTMPARRRPTQWHPGTDSSQLQRPPQRESFAVDQGSASAPVMELTYQHQSKRKTGPPHHLLLEPVEQAPVRQVTMRQTRLYPGGNACSIRQRSGPLWLPPWYLGLLSLAKGGSDAWFAIAMWCLGVAGFVLAYMVLRALWLRLRQKLSSKKLLLRLPRTAVQDFLRDSGARVKAHWVLSLVFVLAGYQDSSSALCRPG